MGKSHDESETRVQLQYVRAFFSDFQPKFTKVNFFDCFGITTTSMLMLQKIHHFHSNMRRDRFSESINFFKCR